MMKCPVISAIIIFVTLVPGINLNSFTCKKTTRQLHPHTSCDKVEFPVCQKKACAECLSCDCIVIMETTLAGGIYTENLPSA